MKKSLIVLAILGALLVAYEVVSWFPLYQFFFGR